MLCASRHAAALASVLEVHGALRVPLRSDLRARVEGVLGRGCRRILLDLSGLLAIDASGIGELIQAYNTTMSEGGVLRIVGANRRVRRLLEISGVFELLTRGAMGEQARDASRGPWHR
jgi:anti-sigma B factor antagonist